MGGVSMEWKEVRLGDIVSIKSGLAYKGAFIGKGENILLGMGCVSFKDKFLFSGARLYEADCDDKYCVEPGDIVLATRQQSDNLPILAMPAIIPSSLKAKKIIYGTNLYKVENHSEVTNDFLFWQLKTPDYIDYISSVKTGSVVRMVTKKNVEDYVFRCPPKEVRDRISKLLWGLDRKIELNNKINADLEEMAQVIFKNWFVDFEPFKDGKFVDSELGMIPEGWKVVVFDNILKVTTTKTGKEGIPEYSVTNTGIHPRDEKFTKNLSKSSAKNKLIRKGNLVFGMSREILNWGIMKEEVGGVSSAYNVYIVDEKIVSTTYLECFIAQRMDYFADLIKPASREGQGVDKALLMKKIICIPPSEVLDVFLEKYNSIMHLTEIRNQENSRLSLLRDTLLPRLMSGELEVPE